MSARAQARRDAEFDRLLAQRREDGQYLPREFSEGAMCAAYEMGKRHGREMDQEERRGSTKPPADEVKP